MKKGDTGGFALGCVEKIPPSPPLETVSQCHCEGVKRPKQSHNPFKILRLPRSLRSLAMTNQDYDTVSYKGGTPINGHDLRVSCRACRSVSLSKNEQCGARSPNAPFNGYLREMVSDTPFRESMKRRRLRSGRPRPVRTLMASWTWREAMVETIPARFPNSTSTPFSGVFRGSP